MEHTATPTLDRVPIDVDDGIGSPIDGLDAFGADSDAAKSSPSATRIRARRILKAGPFIFGLAFCSYLALALLLDFKYHAYPPADAFSRMANGFYILYSNDRHLAAIGFVWEPLQSIADLVVLLGNHLWPDLSHINMAGSLVSALSMAGAVYQMCAALREWGVSRAPRIVLTASFALNPMILYYGANGMSEALFLFTLTTCTRYLLRWMHDGDLRSLAYSAVALGFCYLTRNEAATAALVGGLAVGAVSYWRAQGRRAPRLRTAMSDLLIFVAPAFTAAVGWATISYVIIGQFLDGGALSVRLAHQRQDYSTLSQRVVYVVHAVGALAPFLPVLVAVAAVVAIKRKDPRVLAPVAVFGGSLGFDMISYLGNAIDSALRYWIALIPLGVMILGCLVAAIQTPAPARVGVPARTRSSRAGPRIAGALAALLLTLVVMIPTTASTASGLLNPRIGVEESQQIGFIFHPNDPKFKHTETLPFVNSMDRYFEALHLPDGDVLVDNADSTGCVPQMIVTSDQPRLFVIPNDRDFQRTLADPIAFHTYYLLVPDPATLDEASELSTTYPTLWKTGAGFTKLVHKFQPTSGSGCTDFRLFHVLRHSPEGS
jgi:hypothetical protein